MGPASHSPLPAPPAGAPPFRVALGALLDPFGQYQGDSEVYVLADGGHPGHVAWSPSGPTPSWQDSFTRTCSLDTHDFKYIGDREPDGMYRYVDSGWQAIGTEQVTRWPRVCFDACMADSECSAVNVGWWVNNQNAELQKCLLYGSPLGDAAAAFPLPGAFAPPSPWPLAPTASDIYTRKFF